MSTAVTQTTGNQMQIGGAFRAFAGQQPQESLADGIGGSYGIVGYRGKTWSLRYKGEQYTFVRPDDGTPAGHLDVIFLRQAKVKSRSYYKGFDPNAFEGKAPVCASLDGVTPDAGVTEPQAAHCAVCPRNSWYTNEKGIKTKDCTEYKRVAVLLLPHQTRPMVGGNGLIEPVFLRIPAGSLQSLATYGEQLVRENLPFFAVVTRITFDPDQSHPKFVFRHVKALTDDEAPVVIPLIEDPLAKRVVGDDAPQQAQMRQLPPAPPAQAAEPPPPPPLNPGPLPAATAAVNPATQPGGAQHRPTIEHAEPPIENMRLFGASNPSTLTPPGQEGGLFAGGTQQTVTQAPTPPVTQAPPAPTTVFEDPTESDAQLDALIKGIVSAPQ